jgi:hypothetical protein
VIEREVLLQVDVETQLSRLCAFGPRHDLDDLPLGERAEQLPGSFSMPLLLGGCVMAVSDDALHGAAAITFSAQHLQQHGVSDLEPRHERLRG